MVWSTLYGSEFCFVQDDVENCEFFVWVDEVEELGYFKSNGIGVGHGRKTRFMEKVQSMLLYCSRCV